MKKILSLVFVLAVVAQVNAKGVERESPLGVSVVKLGPVVKLFYRGEESGTVKVTIYDEKGTAIFTETMQDTDDFMRPYNFSELPEGVYTIELTDKNGTDRRKIKHELEGDDLIAKVTRLNKREHRYVLAVPDRGADELIVRIYDSKYRVLYEGTESVDGDFAKVYTVNNYHGRLTFEVTDKERNKNLFLQSRY